VEGQGMDEEILEKVEGKSTQDEQAKRNNKP